jgi:hypothetical protein
MMIRCYCGVIRQGGGLIMGTYSTYHWFRMSRTHRRGGQQRFVQVCRCRAASQLEAREERLTQADASRADAQKHSAGNDAQKRGQQKSILLEAKETDAFRLFVVFSS